MAAADDLKLSVDDEALTTGSVLELMQLQSALRGPEPAPALQRMIELLQPAVTAIEYKGKSLSNLMEVPFKHLKTAVEAVMGSIGKTDPN